MVWKSEDGGREGGREDVCMCACVSAVLSCYAKHEVGLFCTK